MKALRQSKYSWLVLLEAIFLPFIIFGEKLVFTSLLVGFVAILYYTKIGKTINSFSRRDAKILLAVFVSTFIVCLIFPPYFFAGIVFQGIWLCILYEVGVKFHDTL